MPSKTTLVASAAAVALALLPSALAAPTPAANSQPILQCKSLGKGAFGMPSPNNQPHGPSDNLDLIGDFDRTLVLDNVDQQNFEFVACWDDGENASVQTFQGYILAPDGNCVTIDANNVPDERATVRTEECHFDKRIWWGGVADLQHFQFQKKQGDAVYYVNFLGEDKGPMDEKYAGAPTSYNLWSFNRGGQLTIQKRNCGRFCDKYSSDFLIAKPN